MTSDTTKTERIAGHRRSESFAWQKLAMQAMKDPDSVRILRDAGTELANALGITEDQDAPTEEQVEAAFKVVIQAWAEGKLEAFGLPRP